jgi:2-polyprenyl-3-methyl-5-hydroxy-6-metoxy-1,4-benzoquinol methylase
MAGTTIDLARYYVHCLSKAVELKSKMVLDFGAGLGTMSRALIESGANVVAIEPFASEACEQAGIKTYTSIAEIPARHPPFDVVVAIDVIEHLRRPWETLAQLCELLKPKGWLCVKTLNTCGLNARLTRDRWREMTKPDHLIFFTPETLERIFNKAGFSQCVRLKWYTRHSQSVLRRGAHILIEAMNLDGELRYLAQRN